MLEDHAYDVVCFPGLADHVTTNEGLDRETFGAAQRMLVEACIAYGDRLAGLDPPPGLSPEQMRDWRGEGLGGGAPPARPPLPPAAPGGGDGAGWGAAAG